MDNNETNWDTGSHEGFYAYYEQQSPSPGTFERFKTTRDALLCLLEFNLPLYSWYPKTLKHHFERRGVTDRPELVNYAKYPGVNWFSFYSLRKYLRKRGFNAFDRFDLIDDNGKSGLQKLALNAIKFLPPLRLLAHMATSYTVLVAQKQRTA